MTINIQKLVDQLNTRAAAADSNTSTNAMLKLNHAVLRLNNTTGVVEATSKSSLPVPVDSAMLGNIAFVPRGPDTDSAGISSYADSHGGYYMARTIGSTVDSCWSRLVLPADSDASSSSDGGGGYSLQGSVSGYFSGGRPPTADTNAIEKYSFTSDGNATDVGDLTVARQQASGQSSSTHGYTTGGIPTYNVIDKFPFSVDANATDVGDLTTLIYSNSGQSSQTDGYSSGGTIAPSAANYVGIQKFPFAVDENATELTGEIISSTNQRPAGSSSATHGYVLGGSFGNVIQKFPFSTDENTTDVGDLTENKGWLAGAQSATHGYAAGGRPTPSTATNVIEKLSFTSDGNATDVGDLLNAIRQQSGTSSTTHGYSAGGRLPAYSNIIQKYSFATDENATDVGDLTETKQSGEGQQV